MKFNKETAVAAAMSLATVLVGVWVIRRTTAGQKVVNWAFNG